MKGQDVKEEPKARAMILGRAMALHEPDSAAHLLLATVTSTWSFQTCSPLTPEDTCIWPGNPVYEGDHIRSTSAGNVGSLCLILGIFKLVSI